MAGQPVVNCGFTRRRTPYSALLPERTLVVGRRYLFWLSIGGEEANSIEVDPQPLPAATPSNAELTVSLAVEYGPLRIVSGAEGLLRLSAEGAAVSQSPYTPRSRYSGQPGRVLFAVRAWRPGEAVLRCTIRHGLATVLETRSIRVLVTHRAHRHPGALSSIVDYRLADPDDSATIAQLPDQDGSLLLSPATDSTHVMTVRAASGARSVEARISLPEAAIAGAIASARNALRTVAWGSPAPWNAKDPAHAYRYSQPASIKQLTRDLTALAVSGYRLNFVLLSELGRRQRGTYAVAEQLREALARPGRIQVAMLKTARHVLPMAMLYDLPFDTGATDITLCQDFRDAYQRRDRAAQARCFNGACRQANERGPTVVCPGGFWGFRHSLGLPVSTAANRQPAVALKVRTPLWLSAGVYHDFATADSHLRDLENLTTMYLDYGKDRESTLDMLRWRRSDMVYFYCHGGVGPSGVPFLRVGRGREGGVITPDNLFQRNIGWRGSSPLVFLNGCSTADLTPERLMDFVSFFVSDAGACGVIGTEITVFEQLASAFALEFFNALLCRGMSAGEATTSARRALLTQGNPLGLCYIPFLMPDVSVHIAAS